MVVQDEENNGHAEAPIARNFIGELRLRRPVQRFQNHPVAISAIPGKATYHAAVTEVARPHGRAGGDGHAAAHNGVRPQMAHGKVGNVHAPAPPAAVTILLAEQLRDRAIYVFFQGRFEQCVTACRVRVR